MGSVCEKEYLGLRFDNPLDMLAALEWYPFTTIGYIEKEGEDIDMFSIEFKDFKTLKHRTLLGQYKDCPIEKASRFYITRDGGQTMYHEYGKRSLEYILNPLYEPISGSFLLEYRGGSIIRNGEALTSLQEIETFINENPECDQVPFRGLEFMFPNLVTTLIRREWIDTTEEIYQRWVEKCRIY